MSAEKMKGYLGAFVIGGLMGVIGHLMLSFFLLIGLGVPVFEGGPPWAVPLTVFMFGLLGAILTRAGVYPKLMKIGGVGAMLPTSGLAFAITMGTMALRWQGKSAGKAMAGANGPALVFAVGGVVGIIAAVIVVFAIG